MNFKKLAEVDLIEIVQSVDLVDYLEAISFMNDRIQGIIAKEEKEMIWILEHPEIYTAGVSAKEEDLLNSEKFPVYKTNRGGKYTHHSPGQVIVYLMLNLKERNNNCTMPNVRKFIKFLEIIICDSLGQFGIKGEFRDDRIGVWVFNERKKVDEKIASIGVKFVRCITMHGFAINVNNNLESFSGIVPCGILSDDYGICSVDSCYKSCESEFTERKSNDLKGKFIECLTEQISQKILSYRP